MSDSGQPKHILRQVREALGLSRAKLAALIGCSAVYIKKIESGATPMTSSFALKVTEKTSANYFQLVGMQTGFFRFGAPPGSAVAYVEEKAPIADQNGLPLTPASLRRGTWQMPKQEVDRFIETLRFNIEILLDAAVLAPHNQIFGVRGDSPGSFIGIVQRIAYFLDTLAGDSHLVELRQQILDAYELELKSDSVLPFPCHRRGRKSANEKIRAARYAARAKLLKEQSAKTPSLPVPAPGSDNASETSAATRRDQAGAQYSPQT